MSTILRYQIADYLGIKGTSGAETFALMGTGFNTLDESPAPKVDSKLYINSRNSSGSVTGYENSFAYDTDLIKEEAAVMALYKVGRDQLTGEDAEFSYVRVDLYDQVGATGTEYKARKFTVVDEVSGCSGAGGETVKVTGTLHQKGDFIPGKFDISAKTFTAD